MINSPRLPRTQMVVGAFAMALFSMPRLAQAQTLTTVHAFGASSLDGTVPFGELVFGPKKSLYGTTQDGGASDFGTIFTLAPDGTETVLYSFSGGSDGCHPAAALIFDKMHNAYGTTNYCGAFDLGTVFKLTPGGVETVLHSFGATGDGSVPYGALVIDQGGNLYGTTTRGGRGGGIIFKIAADGSETILHKLSAPDGLNPQDRLLLDGKGNLYGTAQTGGSEGSGTVFKLAPNGTFTLLHDFGIQGSADAGGRAPIGGLTADSAGNLYGTTYKGGLNNYDSGTVYKLAPDGTETVLHTFIRPDGFNPSCDLAIDGAGNLYGTTQRGGAHDDGTVFMIAPDGAETIIHSFDGTDGLEPHTGVILDTAGNIYGTTVSQGPNDGGTAFEITP